MYRNYKIFQIKYSFSTLQCPSLYSDSDGKNTKPEPLPALNVSWKHITWMHFIAFSLLTLLKLCRSNSIDLTYSPFVYFKQTLPKCLYCIDTNIQVCAQIRNNFIFFDQKLRKAKTHELIFIQLCLQIRMYWKAREKWTLTIPFLISLLMWLIGNGEK